MAFHTSWRNPPPRRSTNTRNTDPAYKDNTSVTSVFTRTRLRAFLFSRTYVRTLKSIRPGHFRANRFNGNVEVSVRRCDGTGQKRKKLRARTRSSIRFPFRLPSPQSLSVFLLIARSSSLSSKPPLEEGRRISRTTTRRHVLNEQLVFLRFYSSLETEFSEIRAQVGQATLLARFRVQARRPAR